MLMFAETVFPPLPSEIIMPLAGLRAARGSFSLAGAIAAGSVGAMAGNLCWYFAARSLGVDRFRRQVDRYGRWLALDWPEVERARAWFRRHGAAFVCLGRLVPAVRSVVSIPAGMLRMPLPRFAAWSALGTTVWTSALTVAGYALGQQYAQVERYVGPVSTAILVLVALGYGWRVARWRSKA